MQRRGPELHHPTPTHPPNPYAIPSSPPLMDPAPPDAKSRGGGTNEYQRFSSPQNRGAYAPQNVGNLGGPSGNAAGGGMYGQFSGTGYAPPPQGNMQNMQNMPQAPQQQQQQQQFGQWGDGFQGMPTWANDTTARMGIEVGKNAINSMSMNVSRHLPIQHLHHSFNVSNTYVLNKLRLILFPWRHKPWYRGVIRSEAGQAEGYKPPRDDLNAPDLYIPVMALVTYILLSGMIYGFRQDFHPEKLGMTASKSLAVILVEFFAIKLGCYLLNIGGEGTVLDLFAYSGYKFVGIIVTLAADLLRFRGSLYWATFIYVFCANAFFLLRSLRNVVLPDTSQTSNPVSHAQRSKRLHFLFAIAVSQIFSMWLLIRV